MVVPQAFASRQMTTAANGASNAATARACVVLSRERGGNRREHH